ncbi:MAG: hypothetical protein LBP21_08520, partial [Synergistaceae bacterium]|nr:hypothetical protein [Synergistaceae bacterium]
MTRHNGEIKNLGVMACALLAIALFLSPFAAHAALTWNDSIPSIEAENNQTIEIEISGTISGNLSVPDGATVTIIGEAKTTADGITLNIGNDATVVWKANLSGTSHPLISLSNAGTFEVAGGKISSPVSTAISSLETATVKINGGTVEGGDRAIFIESGSVEVSEGTVKALAENGKAIHTTAGNIKVSGGIVQTTAMGGRGIYTTSGNIEISGGKIQATGKNGMAIQQKSTDTKTVTRIIISGTDTKISIEGSKGMAIQATNATIIVYDNVSVAGLENYSNVIFSASWEGTASGAEIMATYGGVQIQTGARVANNKELQITVNGTGGGKDDEYTYVWTDTNSVLDNGNTLTIESLGDTVNVLCTVTGIDKTKPVVSSVTPSGTDEEISGTVAIAFNEIMSTEG